MNIVSIYAQQVIQIVVTIIFGVLGIVIRRLMTQYINTDTKRVLARDVVRAVEQIYKDLHGEDKMAQALNYMADMLAEYGIHITGAEMRMLLEAAVGEFNSQRTV